MPKPALSDQSRELKRVNASERGGVNDSLKSNDAMMEALPEDKKLRFARVTIHRLLDELTPPEVLEVVSGYLKEYGLTIVKL